MKRRRFTKGSILITINPEKVINMSEIRDKKLAPEGQLKLDWVEGKMDILPQINKRFEEERPFEGLTVGISLHLEAKTAYLALVFRNGGATVGITGSNPLSTQDEVCAALAQNKDLQVYAWHGASPKEYEKHLNSVLDMKPDLIIDDGGDLVRLLHSERTEIAEGVIGGCEETTTGVVRLRALAEEGRLSFPMYAVNDAQMKYLFDNRYGTGQSTWDGIMRATNLSIAGKTVAVVGYGWCGRGIAMRADGLGANVIVVEVDPVKAIEAVMEGYRVKRAAQAAAESDFLVTATGSIDALDEEAISNLKDGSILANAGHFDVEISKSALQKLSRSEKPLGDNIREYQFKDGRRVYLLAEGRLVNLAAGDGHPVEIMDTSFALQLLTARYLVENRGKLEPDLYSVPPQIDNEVAELKLKALGIQIDRLTEKQREYLASWK